MHSVRLCRQFWFSTDGSLKGRAISGPVIASSHAVFLVPKSVEAENSAAIAVAGGLIGLLIARAMTPLQHASYPCPPVRAATLADRLDDVPQLRRLKPDQLVVVLDRSCVTGFSPARRIGATLHCNGYDVLLRGPFRKMASSLEHLGYERRDPAEGKSAA